MTTNGNPDAGKDVPRGFPFERATLPRKRRFRPSQRVVSILFIMILCLGLEYAIIASNPVPRHIDFMQTFRLPQFAGTEAPEMPAAVDVILARCPTEAEIAALEADFFIRFEFEREGALACAAADGSRDLTAFEKRFYNSLLVMRALAFSQPLPWTSKPLYNWFAEAVDGIRVRGDIELSFCCDPGGVINIRSHDLAISQTGRWVDPALGDGAISLVLLLAHEARHAENYYHNCANGDKRLTQMGAWGVQYFLDTWLLAYADPEFFAAPDVDYRAYPLADARKIVDVYICHPPGDE